MKCRHRQTGVKFWKQQFGSSNFVWYLLTLFLIYFQFSFIWCNNLSEKYICLKKGIAIAFIYSLLCNTIWKILIYFCTTVKKNIVAWKTSANNICENKFIDICYSSGKYSCLKNIRKKYLWKYIVIVIQLEICACVAVSRKPKSNRQNTTKSVAKNIFASKT